MRVTEWAVACRISVGPPLLIHNVILGDLGRRDAINKWGRNRTSLDGRAILEGALARKALPSMMLQILACMICILIITRNSQTGRMAAWRYCKVDSWPGVSIASGRKISVWRKETGRPATAD